MYSSYSYSIHSKLFATQKFWQTQNKYFWALDENRSIKLPGLRWQREGYDEYWLYSTCYLASEWVGSSIRLERLTGDKNVRVWFQSGARNHFCEFVIKAWMSSLDKKCSIRFLPCYLSYLLLQFISNSIHVFHISVVPKR